jgi:aspartyl protease
VPGYTWGTADLRQRGPVLPVNIAAASPAEQAMRAAGQPVPPPVTVDALIDTGAARSAVDKGTAARLGLQPVGAALIATPTTESAQVPVYAVRFVLPDAVVFEVTAIEATLAGQNIGALLGRDLLSRAVFIYVGYAGQCTISF